MLWAKEALLVLAALEAWETDSLGVAKEIGIGCISRLRKELCKDWELTSESHSCSTFSSLFIKLVKYTLPSVSLRSL